MFESGLVNLYTRDIDAGIRFYRDLLGCSAPDGNLVEIVAKIA